MAKAAIATVTQVTGGNLKPFQANRLDGGSTAYAGAFASASEAFSAINLQVGRTLAWTQDDRGDGINSYTGVMP